MRQSPAAAVLVAALLAFGQAEADEGRNLVPKGNAEQVLLDLDLNRLGSGGERRTMRDYDRVAEGDKVRVCFQASEDGYVTLWSHGANGGVARILPNQYTQGGTQRRGIPLRGGIRHCISDRGLVADGGDAIEQRQWGLEVHPPYGLAELYLHWTPVEDEQLPENSFLDIDGLAKAVGRSGGKNYASTWFSYEVVER